MPRYYDFVDSVDEINMKIANSSLNSCQTSHTSYPIILTPKAPMRVTKPVSPRKRSRRRMTTTNDDTHRRHALTGTLLHQQQLHSPPLHQIPSTKRQSSSKGTQWHGTKTSRPASWHSTLITPTLSQQQQQQQQPQPLSIFTPQVPISMSEMHYSPQNFHLQPNYSVQIPSTIPHSSIPSGEILVNNGFEPINYCCATPATMSPSLLDSNYYEGQHWPQGPPLQSCFFDQSPVDGPFNCFQFDWNAQNMHDYENFPSTSPFSSHDTVPTQFSDLSNLNDESGCYKYYPEEHTDEELLIGMGLYDDPIVSKPPSTDQSFYYCQPNVMSERPRTCSSRRALKLEERFTPPMSDEEDEGKDEIGTKGSAGKDEMKLTLL